MDERYKLLQNGGNIGDGLLIPHYLIHSCLYYNFDTNIISDREYDDLSERLYQVYDQVEHPHKNLIDKDALRTSGFYIRYPLIVESICASIVNSLESKSSKKKKK